MNNKYHNEDERQASLPILIKPFTKEYEGYDESLDELIERMRFLRSSIGKNVYTYYNGVCLSTLDELLEGDLKEVYEKRLASKRKIRQIAFTTDRSEARRILLTGNRRGYVSVQIKRQEPNGKKHNQVIYVDRLFLDRFNPDHLNSILNYRMLASETLGSIENYQETMQKKEEMDKFKRAAKTKQSDDDIDY